VRRAPDCPPVVVVSNMTPALRHNYRLPMPGDGLWHEIINTDAQIYGGSGKGNLGQVEAHHGAAHVTLPPLATLMFVPGAS
jgi:1,4-alpha-glucan branching enzyme